MNHQQHSWSQLLLLHHFISLLIVYQAYAVSYDYSASIKCLVNPLKPQYGGGIIRNPELNRGLRGWSAFGNATIATSISRRGNTFVVASHRTRPQDSVSQKLYLEHNHHYTLSAWIQVSDGEDVVRAIVKSRQGFVNAGSVRAKSGCWSMLKGGLTIGISGPANLHFESYNTSHEIWFDNVSLQPFTQEEWQSTQLQSLDKVRKEKMQVKVVDKDGNPIPNATINFQQKKLGFPFGCAMNKNILKNQAYIDWFTQRFTVTTFEDELKWYSTEISQGKETYEAVDAMIQLCQEHEISIRGHNILWDDPKYQPRWVYSLSSQELITAALKRLNSVMTRYKGEFMHWDVVNENLHFDFFESKLGQNLSSKFYNMAHAIDPSPILFMNDYNTLEDSRDSKTRPDKYLEKLKMIQSFNQRIPMGIGLEGHWSTPVNLPYMRSVLDKLAATGLPIWLTEIDVQSGEYQAEELEKILREAFSHPQVKGIVIWSAFKPKGCYQMCLTDNNFKNLATGDVVDKLIREWGGLGTSLTGKTDGSGSFETSLFHGDYELQIYSPLHSLDSIITSTSFSLDSGAPSFLEIRIY